MFTAIQITIMTTKISIFKTYHIDEYNENNSEKPS